MIKMCRSSDFGDVQVAISAAIYVELKRNQTSKRRREGPISVTVSWLCGPLKWRITNEGDNSDDMQGSGYWVTGRWPFPLWASSLNSKRRKKYWSKRRQRWKGFCFGDCPMITSPQTGSPNNEIWMEMTATTRCIGSEPQTMDRRPILLRAGPPKMKNVKEDWKSRRLRWIEVDRR